jgi:hypothetical protein
MFSRTAHHVQDAFINLFSVFSRSAQPNIKNWVVVEHMGNDDGDGEWRCCKDPKTTNCVHIVDARHTLQKYLQGDPNATDPNARHGAFHGMTELSAKLYLMEELGGPPLTRIAAQVIESISYFSLPFPIWAHIQADENVQPLPLVTNTPALIPLDNSSSCSCCTPRTMFDHRRPIETCQCYLYGLLKASCSLIKIQKCPNCPQGYVGSKCTVLGFSNLNNHRMFTLTLLDDYTAQFTRSEMPFASWVSSTACRYMNHQSKVPFIGEKAFQTAWFSYIHLVDLRNDMYCLPCGESPAVTIWDSVTLSFNRKNILPTLKPLTIANERSEMKKGIKPQQGLQLIPNKQLRKLIQTILNGKPLSLPKLPDESDGPPTASPATKEMIDRVELVPGVVACLSNLDKNLGTLFDRYFDFKYLFSKGTPPVAYQELFLQVRACPLLDDFLPSLSADLTVR